MPKKSSSISRSHKPSAYTHKLKEENCINYLSYSGKLSFRSIYIQVSFQQYTRLASQATAAVFPPVPIETTALLCQCNFPRQCIVLFFTEILKKK